MDENRRSFLKKAGSTALGVGCGLPVLSAGCSALREGSQHASTSVKQWAMVIDLEQCRKHPEVRRVCREACHREHNVPFIPDPDVADPEPEKSKHAHPEEEIKWIWEEKHKHAFPDQTHAKTSDELKNSPVMVLCNHCTNPPCEKVCPTQATWKRKYDGVVMMDMHRCIGCRYCMAACPYGARSFNWRDPCEKGTDPEEKDSYEKFLYFWEDEAPSDTLPSPSDYPARTIGVVEKCTFCAERIRAGRPPACVEAAETVPGGKGALTFGDLKQPGSPVNLILSDKTKHTICRRVSLGTGPNVFYIV